MKYILGALISAGLLIGGYAVAATATAGVSGLSVVDRIYISNNTQVTKIYDQDAKIVCYMSNNSSWKNVGSGISCLKNI